ncbi:MAG: CoA transferase [Dehalococcoidia bacterium]|nr:CoA transferase [Dehalococcoidia bacterium]
MALPLSDIRVVEMSQVLAGPFAAMLLADQGAEVIKVESPEGDSARRLAPNFPGSNGLSLGYLSFNRNKRSVVLDITKPQGLEAAYKLFQWADVLIINVRVGARQRRGLAYADLKKVNPRLIYVSLTAWGANGPDADLPGADVAVQPRVGDLMARVPPGTPPPASSHFYHFDMSTAMLIAYSVMVALRQREQSGQGQNIELSLLQTALAAQASQMTRLVGSDLSYHVLSEGFVPNYLCSDGRYLYITIFGARWDLCCQAIGLEHLGKDQRFDTPEKRNERGTELYKLLSDHFATKPAAYWEARLKAIGLAATVIKEMREVYDDPQVVANDMIIQFEQPGLGTIKAVNIPFKLSANSKEPWLRRHAPTLGEHTFEVLEEMGYTQEEIQSMAEAEVLG